MNTNTINEFIECKNSNMEHKKKMKQYTDTNNSAVNEIANMFIEKCKILDSLYDLYIDFALNKNEIRNKEITNIAVKLDVNEIIKIIDKEMEFAREVNSQMALGMLRIKELIIKANDEKEAEANKNY